MDNKLKYDYIIVGSGLAGSTFATLAKQQGKKCLVIEKRRHLGGNIYTECKEDIQVHKYGPHVFHTSDHQVWSFLHQFTTFNRFTNNILASYHHKLYNLPFNMHTFSQMWGITTPEEAINILKKQRAPYLKKAPSNFEEQALALVGNDLYHTLIEGYTEKQWGRKATSLPGFIIKRLPLRYTFDNNYFDDCYQGVPIGGYTAMIHNMLQDIPVLTNTDFLEEKYHFEKQATQIIYTGRIDEYFNFCYGKLEFRSLRFEEELLPISNFQGNAIINYTQYEIPYTRIIEHKHFEFGQQPITIITREYPISQQNTDDVYYPINDDFNNRLYEKYLKRSKSLPNIHFIGRLGEYKYYDMHQVVRNSLDLFKKLNVLK